MAATTNGNERESLIDDLKLVIRDAEDLLRGTGQQVDEGYQAARARFESTLSHARNNLHGLEEQLSASAREAMQQTDEYVKEHPWQAVGAGALVGLVAGLLLARR